MSTRSSQSNGTRPRPAGAQRSYRQYLGTVLLFELSLAVGIIGAMLSQGWTPRALLPGTDPRSQIAHSRRETYRREDDPPLAKRAPELALRSSHGGWVRLNDLKGRRVVLVFGQNGST